MIKIQEEALDPIPNFVQGRGLLDYATFVPDPITMSSGEAECNTSAVACMVSMHNHNFDCDLRHRGTAHARHNNYNFPGGKHWRPTPIILDSQAAVTMAETARSPSHMCHIDHHFHCI